MSYGARIADAMRQAVSMSAARRLAGCTVEPVRAGLQRPDRHDGRPRRSADPAATADGVIE